MIKKASYISAAFFCLLAISWAIPFKDQPVLNKSERIKIALREVGNKLLLSSRDSTSIISPVIALDTQSYELSFQRDFSFMSDSLVTIVHNTFSQVGISKNYIVEVLRCKDQEVSYSYEMNFEQDRTIVPCSGREVPNSCHKIQVHFTDDNSKISLSKIGTVVGAMSLLFFMGYRFRESEKNKKIIAKDNVISIGNIQFYPEQNKLVSIAETHALSRKECEILSLLVARSNQIIKREDLIKTIWEDKGVIVGRSLDTYISKLRKKLKEDPKVVIANVHGVGYRLEIPFKAK